MNIIVVLLIILVAAVICFYIVQKLPLEPQLKNIAWLIIGLILLIAVIMTILPLIGVNVGNVNVQ